MAVGQTSRANIASVDDPNEFPGITCGKNLHHSRIAVAAKTF